ncbi:MAG: helix-turn-helix domain-containing protein [Anaerolineae bacterium]|nr:helix-turn-helix domain-containing protein [Anaerolineae bacterium]
MSNASETLLPLLVYIQANLDGDLSLTALSRRAGLSPAYLHRIFKADIGETPKHYVERLRLERCAFRLLIHDANLLDVALDCGFRNHETFTRAFRRRFGMTPSAYRDRMLAQHMNLARGTSATMRQGFEVSATKIVRLRAVDLAFIRHVGPYKSVPMALYDELDHWAVRWGLAGSRIWMGLGHDAPIATPESQQRFDAALVVPGPFVTDGRVGHQRLPSGEFALTTHAGPPDTLPTAYEIIFPRLMRLAGYRLVGLPAVEMYHAATTNARHHLTYTDICLPVERVV